MQVIGNPEPVIEHDADEGTWRVAFDWSKVADVDRPVTYRISTGPGMRGKQFAQRVAMCTRAGRAFGPAVVKTDIFGKSYVEADVNFFGRHLNADLKRLGF